MDLLEWISIDFQQWDDDDINHILKITSYYLFLKKFDIYWCHNFFQILSKNV